MARKLDRHFKWRSRLENIWESEIDVRNFGGFEIVLIEKECERKEAHLIWEIKDKKCWPR